MNSGSGSRNPAQAAEGGSGSRNPAQAAEGGSGSRKTVTLYTRAGCHLCEAAEATIRATAGPNVDVRLIDIDSDPALYERYTVRVPVVEVDGVEVAEYEVDPAQLAAVLGR